MTRFEVKDPNKPFWNEMLSWINNPKNQIAMNEEGHNRKARHQIRKNLKLINEMVQKREVLDTVPKAIVTTPEFAYVEYERFRRRAFKKVQYGYMAMEGFDSLIKAKYNWLLDQQKVKVVIEKTTKPSFRTTVDEAFNEPRFNIRDTNVNAKILIVDQGHDDIGEAVIQHQLHLQSGQDIFNRYADNVKDNGTIFDGVPNPHHGLSDLQLHCDSDLIRVFKKDGDQVKVNPSCLIHQTLKDGEKVDEYILPKYRVMTHLKEEAREDVVVFRQIRDNNLSDDELERIIASPNAWEQYQALLKKEEMEEEGGHPCEIPMSNLIEQEDYEDEFDDGGETFINVNPIYTPKQLWLPCGDAGQHFSDYISEDHPYSGMIKRLITYLCQNDKADMDPQVFGMIMRNGLQLNPGQRAPDGTWLRKPIYDQGWPIMEHQLDNLCDLALSNDLEYLDVVDALMVIEHDYTERLRMTVNVGDQKIRMPRNLYKMYERFPTLRKAFKEYQGIIDAVEKKELDPLAKIFEAEIDGRSILVDVVSKFHMNYFDTHDQIYKEVLECMKDPMFEPLGDPKRSRESRAHWHTRVLQMLITGYSVKGQKCIQGFAGDLRSRYPQPVMVGGTCEDERFVLDLNTCNKWALQLLPNMTESLMHSIVAGRPWKPRELDKHPLISKWALEDEKSKKIIEMVQQMPVNELMGIRVKLMSTVKTLPVADRSKVWKEFNLRLSEAQAE